MVRRALLLAVCLVACGGPSQPAAGPAPAASSAPATGADAPSEVADGGAEGGTPHARCAPPELGKCAAGCELLDGRCVHHRGVCTPGDPLCTP